tara:strand:- start:186 stop:365 length:180 start_codon:yes stop_codon:yes gene_type:complete
MDIKEKIYYSNVPSFYSNQMIITEKSLTENHLKNTYKKKLISDLDYKHEEWSKYIGRYF